MMGPFLPPIQSEIHLVAGSPEGVVHAPVAFMVIDALTGDMYVKRTPITVATGWGLINSSGTGGGTGLIITTGSPEGVLTASPPSFAWDPVNKILYVKDTGTNTNTGWRELIA